MAFTDKVSPGPTKPASLTMFGILLLCSSESVINQGRMTDPKML